MNDVLIVIIGGLFSVITGAVGYFIALYKLKPEVKVMNSQEKSNLANAAEVAAGALVEYIKSARDERVDLEKRIEQLEEHRDVRQKQIDNLQLRINELQNQIAIDTRDTIELRKQVAEMETKYNRMRRVNEKLVMALNEADIPIPDLNGDLTDSIASLKLMGKK